MVDGWLFVLTLAGALGCGLAAGAFYAFSSFVMRALMRLPAPTGMAAMQSINVEAPKPWFMLGFLGAAVVCVVAVIVSVIDWDEEYARYLLSAGVVYLVGMIGVTAVYHVPRNDALATIDPRAATPSRRGRRTRGRGRHGTTSASSPGSLPPASSWRRSTSACG